MNLPDQLHFLRPEAFYAFIPLLLFIVLYLIGKATSLSWKSVCDDRLLPYILTSLHHSHWKSDSEAGTSLSLLLIMSLFLCNSDLK